MAEGSISLQEPGSPTKALRTVTQTVNSSVVHQEVMTIGGAGSTLQIAAVVASAPASTEFGLGVRIISGPSSAADAVFRVQQGVGNSSAADRWLVSAANSSAQDYVPVRIVNSSADGFASVGLDYTDASTTSTLAGPTLAYNNGTNATMRTVSVTQPLPVQLRTGTLSYQSTTAFLTSTNSTAVYALISSVASLVQKVYAIHVTSTHTRPSTIVFMSSLVGDLWAGQFGSGSSGVTGFNMAVTPPAFLFQTRASEALNVRIEEGSTASNSTTLARVSLSYFAE